MTMTMKMKMKNDKENVDDIDNNICNNNMKDIDDYIDHKDEKKK